MESSLPSTQILDSGESAERKNEAKNYSEVMSTLPKAKGLRGNDFYLYQRFWYAPFSLEGLMSVQEHFNPQSTDIFLASFPKTGTTWLKALTFAILTRSRLSGSTTSSLLTKMPHDCVLFLEFQLAQNPGNRDSAIPLISTHVPYSCLPKSIISSSCKIIYICRDAKDSFVSLWYFVAKLQRSNNVEPLPLEEVFELFCNGIANYGPYWDHVLGYWRASLEFPEKILFLTYEEMMKDTAAHATKLAEFMGCSFTLEEEEEGEVQKIISMCSFEKLSNLEVNKNGKRRLDTSIPIQNSIYFRRGKRGDWENHLTPEMGARLDDIMEQKLKGSGLKLPR
ncbi:PREDICTED: flavonol sulfotransferase-like [Populus euphratica]|uniref:Sulfotransferase n=1 Tax=Populus euphratica TaxID=75702 RepID=A0AAJ6T9T6_POPEU|nr:PREDICTED: flavonol sulfotransferase-like [Populus euphratica]